MLIRRCIIFILFSAGSWCYSQDRPVQDTLLIADSSVHEVIATPAEEFNPDEEEEDEEDVVAAVPDTLSYREVPDSISGNLKKRKDFAYANDPTYWLREQPRIRSKGFWDHFYDFFASKNVRVFFYILLFCLLIFAIYRIIVVNNLYVFYSSGKKRKELLLEGEQGIEDEKLDDKINAAIKANDFRQATRFLYLKSLRLMNEKGWIRYSSEATNHDYVKQSSGTPVAKDFAALTRAYEYVWYGEFQLQPSQFEIIHNNFRNLYSSIRL
jgi:hypothetical protein